MESVLVDVTFNGQDTTPNPQPYRFYSVMNVFPRSGPADGTGGVITVHGYGLNTDGDKAKCKFDGKEYDVVKASSQELQCKIP